MTRCKCEVSYTADVSVAGAKDFLMGYDIERIGAVTASSKLSLIKKVRSFIRNHYDSWDSLDGICIDISKVQTLTYGKQEFPSLTSFEKRIEVGKDKNVFRYLRKIDKHQSLLGNRCNCFRRGFME